MKVLKPFIRNGVRYRRGDDAPTDVDKNVLATYASLGMIGKPSETPPAPAPKAPTASRQGRKSPANTQAGAPANAQSIGPVTNQSLQVPSTKPGAPSEPGAGAGEDEGEGAGGSGADDKGKDLGDSGAGGDNGERADS